MMRIFLISCFGFELLIVIEIIINRLIIFPLKLHLLYDGDIERDARRHATPVYYTQTARVENSWASHHE